MKREVRLVIVFSRSVACSPVLALTFNYKKFAVVLNGESLVNSGDTDQRNEFIT